jgi:putative DNA methylase
MTLAITPDADAPHVGNDTRLIERWLPIAALGEESIRERRSLQALPPTYYLHVWWARRPLVASRAAVLASVLPSDADRSTFMHALGIHGDPVAVRRRLDLAKKTGENLGLNPYGYNRAFQHVPDQRDRAALQDAVRANGMTDIIVLDPTAGGGSIPFESARLGFATYANDINPVAALIEKATFEFPLRYGAALIPAFNQLAEEFTKRAIPKYQGVFPAEPPGVQVLGYLWARTICCPYCEGLVPLSPNWRLSPGGTGVRIQPRLGTGPGDPSRRCDFEIVGKEAAQSAGTVADGDGTCPFPDCGRVIDGDDIKRQAQAGSMGEQLFAVVFKRRIETRTKAGKPGRDKWERDYRAARPEDDNLAEITARLAEKMEEWTALDYVPSERFPSDANDDRPIQYGMPLWRDLFSPRQLLGHGTGVEVFREMLADYESKGTLSEVTKSAFVYLALAMDKMADYNSRMCRWHGTREVMVNTFDRHDFSFKWSYAEMAPLIAGLGYDWVTRQVGKCIGELVELGRPDVSRFDDLLTPATTPVAFIPPSVTITCKPGEALDHIADASVDVVVMDPPYYDNVMYAELSDFFYVWLKRTAGHVVPELFTRNLTDKENEAVANPAKFAGQKGAKALAGRDYQERMARIFEECRRVLKLNGIMTLMFTHKATGAWDALTKGLMHAGFTITASWPINTEAEGSLHIKNKSAANSTIFLVCRPRVVTAPGASADYWEDVEPLVARAVRTRVAEFQQAGIGGVDLYLACFGPALEEFSRHWPLKRGTPRPKPETLKRRKQAEIFEEEWDPYAVTPEDALDAARREVKRWRLEQLTHMKGNDELDPLTSFFVLAWDAFRAPVFPYDEALRLSRAVGVDLDKQVVGVLMEKKGSDLVMWDSARRAAKGALGPADGSRGMIDALHHAAHYGRTRTLQAAREMLGKVGVDKEPMFFAAMEAVLEVLPVGKAFSGIDLDGDLGAAGSDFEALENLRKLAFSEQVDAPAQLELWAEPATA